MRQAGPNDLDALVALRRRSQEERDGPIDDRGFEARWHEWFEREKAQRIFWLADLDGVPIGTTNLLVYDRMPTPGRPSGQWGYLANMYVIREHRDRGVGAMLLMAVIEHAEHLELERIVLRPTEQSIPFYGRAGFRPADDLRVLWLRE